ncbi:unnamed protein product [Cyprideis torosa]|uniref:Muskelin N-terminal domain-containing protein n=1 Tax=Cyprideis torosa TaxID=163714 RepID=A0A7R8W736_9CRUS|nr:unnamed protein product [Cyprideis torosa]CAG0882896.1 unnamed protein product [Cyprideis torosa]
MAAASSSPSPLRATPGAASCPRSDPSLKVTASALPQSSESVLPYSIFYFTSQSGTYTAEKIKEDNPRDQDSRWSAKSNHHPQYIVLKLDYPAVVKRIRFGKFEKAHVCNIKRFRVDGGMTESCEVPLLEAGLSNNSKQEVFNLKHTMYGKMFPCSFIKITPLQAFGPNFNYSIWFVELTGIYEPAVVEPCLSWYHSARSIEAVRLCLKHFRQRGYADSFDALLRDSGIQLEHPVLTELHSSLVERGDFEATERILERCVEQGMMDKFLVNQELTPIWTEITGCGPRPGMRGGHQMCIDPDEKKMYLFGGWDGSQDLADFWVYDIESNQWTCLSQNTEMEGGPSARSCHKMVLDPIRKQLFSLGRYVDIQSMCDENEPPTIDFYVYDINTARWTIITDNTASMGGPGLLFDHQMCLDPDKRVIYVLGGKILARSSPARRPADSSLSGLFSYEIPTNTWREIRTDSNHSTPGKGEVWSRYGHSMCFHTGERKLYTFAGTRSMKEHLNDFFAYDLEKDELEEVDASRSEEAPEAGVTQRATIDTDSNRIHMLCGMPKGKDRQLEGAGNSLWIFYLDEALTQAASAAGKWSCVYRSSTRKNAISSPEPCPRYAHQFVYDHINKVHYLFGGNPGTEKNNKTRLDDFWSLQLCRLSKREAVRQCLLAIRKQRYLELCSSDPFAAMHYLQSSYAQVVDRNSPSELDALHLLPRHLFESISSEDAAARKTEGREGVFSALGAFFPEEYTQPKGNLVDLVKI